MQNHVHIDQCVSANSAVQVPVFLQTLTGLNDTLVARIKVGCCQTTPKILSDLCCLPCEAAAIGSANVDTWPLINCSCYHVSEIAEPYGM